MNHKALQRIGPCTLAVAAALILTGCAALQQILGTPVEQAQCTITGSIVGADGKAPARIDLKWEPGTQLSVSTDLLKAQVSGNTFTITQIAVGQDATKIEGNLYVGEEPIPPMPRRYKGADVPINLPRNACKTDLGQITLPVE